MPLIQGIIDTVNVPKLTTLVQSVTLPSIITNPVTGRGTLGTHIGGVSAFGVTWHAAGNPVFAGRSSRAFITFEDVFLELQAVYELADLSNVYGESVRTQVSRGFLMFELGQPLQIEYDVLPGWGVDLFWLVAP